MKKSNIENEAQALEYLRYVSINWGRWEIHHRKLMQAIRIILRNTTAHQDLLNTKEI